MICLVTPSIPNRFSITDSFPFIFLVMFHPQLHTSMNVCAIIRTRYQPPFPKVDASQACQHGNGKVRGITSHTKCIPSNCSHHVGAGAAFSPSRVGSPRPTR